ncbi:porin PorA family protein [Streptomyces phaeochromogenes]|uniref:porin PorA family protein n=1 Tax=Streptomyces phaeochromogenes TaxID=1923 RepID=UPI003679A5B3
MSIRRSSIVLAAVGLALAALAVLVRYVVVPIATKLPGDTDETVHYSGKATMLNSEALQSGDTAHAINSNVPIAVDRRLRVTSTHGDTAVMKDVLTVHSGNQDLSSSHTYAIDRKAMNGSKPPSGTDVEPSKGALSSAFPANGKRDDSYSFYDSTTRAIVPVQYTGSAKREGRAVNVYKITAVGPVKDPATLKSLPPALPKKLVADLAPSLPAATRAEFTPAAVAALPDPVPLTYTGKTTIVAYVDRQTGIAIDQTIDQQVVANTVLGGSRTSLLPVSAFDFKITPASVSDLGDKAASAGLLLTLMTDITPLVLVVIAAALILIAYLRRRRPQSDASAISDTDAATGKLVA